MEATTASADPVRTQARGRRLSRIGGAVGAFEPTALERLRVALGAEGRCLSEVQPCVVQYDCCWLDGAPLRNESTWRAALLGNRIADIRGAFTAAWLTPDGALHVARDSIGELSLFYVSLPQGFLWASTVHALLASRARPYELEISSVARYLAYAYVPGRRTLIEPICELLPGEELIWVRGQITTRAFWQIPATPDRVEEESALSRELRRRIERAVTARLPEADSVGATLSGGIDSSLVVAVIREQRQAPLHTFSVSFGEGYAHELSYSSLVAAHCGTSHHIVEVSPEFVSQYLDDTVALFSIPNGDPLTVPNAALFRQAANHCDTLLNGEGGDPSFGGPKNLPMLLSELYAGAQYEDSGTAGPGAESRELTRAADYLRAHLKCFDDLNELFRPGLFESVDRLEEELVPYLREPRFTDYVDRLNAINVTFKGAHHILPKVDAIGSHFGVRARSPLFDRDVVEWAFAIPAALKLKGSVEKYLLKQSVADLLPRAIIERRKSGMLVPVEAWFSPRESARGAGPLLSLAKERLLDGLAVYDLCDRKYLERLLGGKLGGLRPRHGAKIWLLVTLEAWLRTVWAPARIQSVRT